MVKLLLVLKIVEVLVVLLLLSLLLLLLLLLLCILGAILVFVLRLFFSFLPVVGHYLSSPLFPYDS